MATEGGTSTEAADALLAAGKYDLSVVAYTEAIKGDARNGTLYCQRAAAYLELERWREASVDAGIAAKLQPASLDAHIRSARAQLALGNLVKADAACNAALQLDKRRVESAAAGAEAEPNAELADVAGAVAERVAEAQAQLLGPLMARLNLLGASAGSDAGATDGSGGGGQGPPPAPAADGAGGDAAGSCACAALRELSGFAFGRPRMKDAAGRQGAMAAVARVMQRSLAGDASDASGGAGEPPRVCEAGCKALRTLAFNHAGNNKQAAASGAVTAVAAALAAFPDDVSLQAEGLWALMVFCKESFNVAAVRSAAPGVAAAACTRHRGEPAVRSKAMGLSALLMAVPPAAPAPETATAPAPAVGAEAETTEATEAAKAAGDDMI
eukprot:g4363.t1